MQFWIKAASALPYTDDVGRSVVDTLLDIASSDLSPYIPMVAWDWLNKRPVLHPESVAFRPEGMVSVVQMIRELRDVELFVSYLHIVWSEWCQLGSYGVLVMRHLIREEFGGIGATGYRKDLIWRLVHVLSQLDEGQGHIYPDTSIGRVSLSLLKAEYEELWRELLEMDEEGMKVLTGMSSSCRPFSIY